MPHAARVWIERPLTGVPEWSGRGRKPTRERVVEGQHEAPTVKAAAELKPPPQWQSHWIKEGSKGPMAADFWAMESLMTGSDIIVVRQSQ